MLGGQISLLTEDGLIEENISIDKAFASYLASVAQQKASLFKKQVRFVLHYRNYLSDASLCNHKLCQPAEHEETGANKGMSGKENKLVDFQPTSECIPDHSNEFVLVYCAKDSVKKVYNESQS